MAHSSTVRQHKWLRRVSGHHHAAGEQGAFGERDSVMGAFASCRELKKEGIDIHLCSCAGVFSPCPRIACQVAVLVSGSVRRRLRKLLSMVGVRKEDASDNILPHTAGPGSLG
jgi:hypothetical protein